MSDRLGSFKSGRSPTGMASPRMSDNLGPKFGVTFSNQLLNDNMSVKSTKTGVLKEVSQNAPRLTQQMIKKSIPRLTDQKPIAGWTSDPDFARNENFAENRQHKVSNVSHKKSRHPSQVWFREVEELESLVNRKDDLVVMIDENEVEIEKLVEKLTSKKRGIRDEQNKLLKELEDLGLKLKDFDKPMGINLRNCTVVSPYLTRCSQQVINKLRGVTENISNKETKDEVFRAIKSITSEREERENLVISLLSFDNSSLRERLNMLREDLEGKNGEKAETISRLEGLAAEISELDQIMEDDKKYQEKLHQLQSLKNDAVQTATNTAEILRKVLQNKNSIEIEIRSLHQAIQEKVNLKNTINTNLTNYIDSLSSDTYSNVKAWLSEIRNADSSNCEFFSGIVSLLRKLDVCNQLDSEFTSSNSVTNTKELAIGTINLIGRVISMMGRTNAENAISSFKSDYLLVSSETSIQPEFIDIITSLINKAEELLPYKFESSPSQEETENFIQKLKFYLTELSKNLEEYYEMVSSKLELNDSIRELMREVQLKEQKALELNREQALIVHSIPEIKSQSRAYNYQLALLQANNSSQQTAGADEQPRETVDDCEDGLPARWPNPASDDRGRGPAEQLAARRRETQAAETRVKELGEAAAELGANIRRLEHEREYIVEKVKTYRRALADGLGKELKQFQCIASLFDYMSKPVLSREIGVSVMDNLLHDLAGVVQQITNEINRQKRIIKLVNKNEDYSHEGRLFLTLREDIR
jgi:chromosome segregation ATPase